ncbi:hypothetical protein [Synechococcus sp. RS9916]|uniref:hypothetical protein n=1 Tax=Synechococcus sp. RS9916 TaxID=221359 RepID=UPI0012EADDB0|nr:hypothetical protein [Synechococcus sp. RS9916]
MLSFRDIYIKKPVALLFLNNEHIYQYLSYLLLTNCCSLQLYSDEFLVIASNNRLIDIKFIITFFFGLVNLSFPLKKLILILIRPLICNPLLYHSWTFFIPNVNFDFSNLQVIVSDFLALHTKNLLSYLRRFKPNQYISIRHGVTISPLCPVTSDQKKLYSDFSLPSEHLYLYTNTHELDYFSTVLPCNSSKFLYIPVLRLLNKSISYSSIDSSTISIFTRPISPPYLSKDDILDFIYLANQITAYRSDLTFVVKNHPKDKHKYVYRLLKKGLTNCSVYEAHYDAISLARKSKISITFYSNLSVDFSYLKIPHFEFYCKSLETIHAESGLFHDCNHYPSLDYRYFGLSPVLHNSDQLHNALLDNCCYEHHVDFSYNAHIELFNPTLPLDHIYEGLPAS